MVFDISKVTGIGEYSTKPEKSRTLYYKGQQAFLIVNFHTLEVRCDRELSHTLQTKYESVMQSRYFGKGGIEIVHAGQLSEQELCDLVRLSYNLTK